MITSKRVKSSEMASLMGEIDVQMDNLRRGFDPGEKVHGTVVSVGNDYIVLDINSKMQGIIDRVSWPIADMPLPEEGDELDAYFVEVQHGAARLVVSNGAGGVAVDQTIMQSIQTQLPLEGRVEKEVNGGYEVTVAGQRAFCPYSQINLFRKDAPETYIGKTMNFLVTEYEPEERTLVVSHRALLEREREEKREQLKAELKEGMVRDGVVTKIMPFGVFVDIGGIEGLIPMRELSWDRTLKAEDVVKESQSVRVSVLAMDWDNNKFSFSLRDLTDDPWTAYAEDFEPGDYVTGTVVKLMPFGAFVMLRPGVEGLVPVSRLGNGRRINHPREAVSEGDELDLQIDTMDAATKRISLKVIDKRVRDLNPGEIGVGAHIKGLVESIKNFGIFVRISEDKTGLVHVGDAGIERGGNPAAKMETKFPLGSEIDVVIKAVDGDRISLTLPGSEKTKAAEDGEENIGELLRSNNTKATSASIGSIGNMLDDLFK